MRAVVYESYGAEPVVRDLPPPECPDDGVVVDVRATGVCRSDWHAWKGHDPVPLPMVPGHEFAGVIATVGSSVTGWSVGDRVTVPFVIGCGTCEWCRAGEQQVCPDQQQPGFTYAGSWAEQVVVPAAEANLVRLPDSVDFVAGAALGCRFATSYRALVTHGQVVTGPVGRRARLRRRRPLRGDDREGPRRPGRGGRHRFGRPAPRCVPRR